MRFLKYSLILVFASLLLIIQAQGAESNVVEEYDPLKGAVHWDHKQAFENNRKWALFWLGRAESRIRVEQPSDPKKWLPVIHALAEKIKTVSMHVISGGACDQNKSLMAFVPEKEIGKSSDNIYFCRHQVNFYRTSQVKLIQLIIHETSHLIFPEQAILSKDVRECQATLVEYMIPALAGQVTDTNSGYLRKCKLDLSW